MQSRFSYFALGSILLLYLALSCIGIAWGLPSRSIDKYLFGGRDAWSGENIYRLAKAGDKFSPTRGADVDVDPIGDQCDSLVPLTANDEDVAKILLRYRLYTNQPDEMITMMALAGMRPGSLDLDPRLYQYGGLFIYPVGALIKLGGILGLIDVRGDVTYYLDNPDEFGKFYIVARAYAAGWGLIGVVVVFLIARRLAGARSGLLAALLFTLMPVVVCMAHEGKPHLPGAALMLLAVYFAIRFGSPRAAGGGESRLVGSLRGRTGVGVPHPSPTAKGGGRTASTDGLSPTFAAQGWGTDQCNRKRSQRDWWLMCVCCGAAFGMVLSSLPIFVLIPLVAWFASRQVRPSDLGAERVVEEASGQLASLAAAVKRSFFGLVVASLVYLVTNPYIVINALFNREVLQSNFGNSLAMYDIARVSEGLTRVLELTVEGATFPILLTGVAALVVAFVKRDRAALLLIIPAAVIFLQFVLIGAGKPAEYGRFGIFVNTALAVGTACIIAPRSGSQAQFMRWLASLTVVVWVAVFGAQYLRNFRADASDDNTRTRLAQSVMKLTNAGHGESPVVAVHADPAPYGCPPLPFVDASVVLIPRDADLHTILGDGRYLLIEPRDSLDAGFDLASLGVRVQPSDSPSETTISWANKPFHVELLDFTSPPGTGPD